MRKEFPALSAKHRIKGLEKSVFPWHVQHERAVQFFLATHLEPGKLFPATELNIFNTSVLHAGASSICGIFDRLIEK
jgi:hypothetical protein